MGNPDYLGEVDRVVLGDLGHLVLGHPSEAEHPDLQRQVLDTVQCTYDGTWLALHYTHNPRDVTLHHPITWSVMCCQFRVDPSFSSPAFSWVLIAMILDKAVYRDELHYRYTVVHCSVGILLYNVHAL